MSRSAALRRAMRAVPARLAMPLLALALPLAASASAPAAAVAASPAGERSETPVAGAREGDGVAVSLVRLRAPLPTGVPTGGEACEWIQHLRFRRAGGPSDPLQADAVVVLMPGNLEGAGALDPLARNAVRAAAARGRSIEVWATDRRANCLEDLTGLDAMERSGDPADYASYYYGGAQMGGQRFAGWRRDPAILAELGVEQTVRDYHAVLTRELPDQAWRERHVVCGGHSLAGALVELYASWDFDGDPATTTDAGFRQCAGFFGLETVLDIGLTSGEPASVRALRPLVPGLRWAFGEPMRRALRAGTILRHEELLGIGPETMAMMEAASVLALRQPGADATPWLRSLPRTRALRTYFGLAGSPTLADLMSGRGRLQELRLSHAALLGQMFDDNGSALSVIRASFGFPTGAPLIRNRLPNELQLPGVDWLFRPGPVVIPRRTTPQALTSWVDYDELGSGPTQIGRGTTSPGSEVTDAREFARIMHEGPTNLTESWFPTRLIVDIGAAGAGDRSGGLAGAIHPRPVRRKPRLVVLGGSGVVLGTGIRPLDPHVILPGYEHLDVLTAAERQNDGRPEGSSSALLQLIEQTTPR